MITIFTKGSLQGDHRHHSEAIAIVLCDDVYITKFINKMDKENLLHIEKLSKKWKHFIDIEWL